MKKLFNIFLLFLGFTLSFAQQYPVRLIPVVIPPYSLKLGDYATSTDNKLQLQVLMTDLMEPQHQTGLKFSLEAGLNAVPYAQSNDFVVGMQPFMLYPGSNLTLTNIDVRALFELQNLNGINAVQYAQPLSDGVYRFCFQAYDYYTKLNLSDKTCTTVFLVQYEPPMLNLPQRGEKVIKQGEFQNLVFQWMPRQIAPNTRYIFTLKELWDVERDPVSGFLSSPPLWREETYAPTLFYGLDKTQLIAGKRYAWQVQAKSGNPVFDANPTEDNGVYRNNGLSEIFYFDYVENCAAPTLLMAKNAGRGRVELSWNLAGQPSGLYTVQYRKRGSTSDWQTEKSYQPRYIITGLEDQTEYEYRIGSVCGNLQTFNNTNPITDGDSAGNAYAYSGVQYFTTDSKDKTNQNYQCGVMPAVDIANKSPLQSLLGANEVFTAGDFPVTVISAQGSNGIYSGTGYIVVPYLADTKIKVSFNNIKLNTDKKLIEGVVETTYDPTEKNVISVDDILNDLGNLFDGIIKIIDDAIIGEGMSPKDFDDLSNNLGTYTSQSGSTVSNLYDQGLVSTELKDKIQAEKDKIDALLKNLNCTKDEKGKGSNEDNFSNEDECTEKLKELKALLQNYQNMVNEAIENRCIWNIAPDENLKGKTFYFQTSIKNNDGEGKKMHKLKTGDYPISFNKNGAVYTFKSKDKIYRPFSDNSYYFSKTSEDKYTFETGNTATLIDVKIDKDNANAISINNQIITAQQDCTDAKERGKGLSENLVFSRVVKDKYSVSVEKNSKGELISTFKLLGKGNSKISDSQKTDIEQEVQNSIDDVLKDLKNPDELSKIQTNDSGFYVKQMTGKEWITTLSDLGTNVWENAALPETYWNEDKGSKASNIRMPALFTGVSDGVIGEVTQYPQLIKLGYDVATKPDIRNGLWESVKGISVETIKEASVDFYEQKKANYTSDKAFIVQHTVSKDAVELASLFMGGGVAKGLKNATDKVEDGVDIAAKRIKKEALEKARKEFLQGFDETFINKLKQIPNYDKLEAALVESWKKHHGSKFSLQYIYDNNLVDKIAGFEIKLNDNLGNFTADMKLKGQFGQIGKSIEFKSWKTGSFSLLSGPQYKNQLKAYMQSGDFEQIFDAQKLIKDGVANPDLFVKEKIVSMIKNNAEEFKDFFPNKLNDINELNVNSEITQKFIAK